MKKYNEKLDFTSFFKDPDKFYHDKCSKCAYHHGKITCVISPCPTCIGSEPQFPELNIEFDLLQSALRKIFKKK